MLQPKKTKFRKAQKGEKRLGSERISIAFGSLH